MRNMTLEKIAQALGGRLYGAEGSDLSDREVQGVVIDNRQVEKDYLFIPIRGARVDGHSFIGDAFAKGVLGVLSDHVLEDAAGPYIVVKDTEQALKDLAAYYREQIDAYVIGIIGSVGKTSTKEMVASVLGQHFSVLKTQGNFNNEIGLPLTLFCIRPSHQVAERFVGVPYIRWFQNFRMSNGLFKFFRCQVAAVSFCKCKTIIFYIVAYSAFDLLNIMAAACYGSDQMYTEDIFHTSSNDGTAFFFCKNV